MKTSPAQLKPVLRRTVALLALVSVALAFAGLFDLIDVVSFILLFIIAWICRLIFDARHEKGSSLLHGQSRIWLLMAWGFVYLSLDELLSIHEGMDRLVHWLFAIRETGLTDRIDDLIILVYLFAGLVVLYFHRREISVLHQAKWPLLYSFVLLFLMVLVDAASNRADIAKLFLAKEQLPAFAYIASLAEELLKIGAEILLISFFFSAYESVHGQSSSKRAVSSL